MRLSTILRLAAVVALFGVMAYSLPAQDQSSDDVAAAARKAREQQKKETTPKKVFTNDDIPTAKNASDSSAKNANGDAAQTSDKTSDKDAESDTKGEAYWRKQFQKVRDQLAQAEQELDVMQKELNKAQVQYYPDPQTALMQQNNRSDINDKSAKIDAKKKQIDDLKQQLSDMEDELRKSGGDPGWAR
jgi:chromosome segregation ATPase